MIEMQSCIEKVIYRVTEDDQTHCRWLNTLSMLKNVAARKITTSEHPLRINEVMLKHATEETRHAYYLKRQISKIYPGACPTFESEFILSARKSYHYLHALDWRISRILKKTSDLSGFELKRAAYLLVTYAIEIRADSIYGSYEKRLRALQSPVSVRGILAEEEQHLAEINTQMEDFFDELDQWKSKVCALESELFLQWLVSLDQELNLSLSDEAVCA